MIARTFVFYFELLMSFESCVFFGLTHRYKITKLDDLHRTFTSVKSRQRTLSFGSEAEMLLRSEFFVRFFWTHKVEKFCSAVNEAAYCHPNVSSWRGF